MDIAQSLQDALHRSTEATDLTSFIEPPKKGWSDELLTKLVKGLHFPSTAYLRIEKPRILNRFFLFYTTGEVKEEDTVVGILNDVIAIALTPMGLIWKPSDKKVEGFYPTNTSDPPPLVTYQAGALTFSNSNSNYGSNSLIQFQNYLHDVIKGIDPGSPETALEKSVTQLATFLALTLYRFATKNATEIDNAFKTKQYRNNLTNLVGWPTNRPFSPPCEKCLKICEVALDKGLLSTSKLFTKVVHEFVLTQKGNYPDPNVAGILAAALLTDTAKNGLEMINMLHDVQIITQMTWKVIMAKTYNTLTRASWNKFVTFFRIYSNTKCPQYSYRWAMIIDHGYFGGLAPEKNVFLATVFGSVIAHVHGNGIWEAEWTKQVSIPEDAKFLGTALFKMSQSLDEAQTAPEGADVMMRARELKHKKLISYA